MAASAVGLGRAMDGSLADHWVPRTPTGPSDITIEARPMPGTAGSDQTSWPDNIETFVSRSSWASASSTAASWVAFSSGMASSSGI